MDAMKEVTRSLVAVKTLVSSTSTLIGEGKSVKCIIDSDMNYQLTSNGLNYMKAIQSKDWIYNVLYDHCYHFEQSHGFGSEEFLVFVGGWCECFLHLMDQDVPLQVIKHSTSQILQKLTHQFLIHHRKHWKNLHELSAMFNDKSLLKNTSPLLSQRQQEYGDKKTSSLNVVPNPNVKTPSGKNNVSFMRYSRHVMAEIKEKEMFKPYNLIEEGCLNEIVKCLCGIDENSRVCEPLCKVIFMMYENYWKQQKLSQGPPTSSGFFNLSSNNVILQRCYQSSPICSSIVFDGILVPTTIKDFYDNGDNSFNYKQTTVNILLMNTIAYGDNLDSNSKNVNIREILNYNKLTTSSENNFELEILKCLHENNVNVIFHHGKVAQSIQECCYHFNILLVHVANYEVLFRISVMTRANICFGFKCGINRDRDIKRASLSFVPCIPMDKLTLTTTKTLLTFDNVLGYIQVHNCLGSIEVAEKPSFNSPNEDCELLYTVLLDSRTIDVYNLQEECFVNCLKRAEHFFMKSKSTLKDGLSHSAEIRFVDILQKNLQSGSVKQHKDIYLAPEWLCADTDLFHNLVTEKISLLFESYCRIINLNNALSSSVRVEDVIYKTSLWKESLFCVIKISSTLKYDNSF